MYCGPEGALRSEVLLEGCSIDEGEPRVAAPAKLKNIHNSNNPKGNMM